MKICIDARWIFPEISGIGLYTQNLIRALGQIDRENEYVLLFLSDAIAARTLTQVSGFRFQVSSFRCRTNRHPAPGPRHLFQRR
ncbi:MAG: hypothetical protein ACREBG_05055 [Pyrinomonadaceae bacterium]